MADAPRLDPLRDIRHHRLSMLLDGNRCRVHLLDATVIELRVKQMGMDYIGGQTEAGERVAIPLTAIAFVEFP